MLNVKTDSKLKARAQGVARDLGLPLGTVINRYLQTFVLEQRVIFEKPEVPNAETVKILRQAERDIKTGKNLIAFKNAKEMDAYLLSM